MTSRQISHMSSEIAEQPAAARRTLDALVPLRPEIRALMGSRRRVLFVARGSSDNAAIYGRYLLETAAGVPAGLAAPSVATHYGARLDLSDTLVVAVSQSGETTEIVQTQAWAASCGAASVAVTNDAGSTLATEADLALITQAGPELAVPATKTYLTQLVAMAVLSDALGGEIAEPLQAVPAAISSLLPVDVTAAARALAEAEDVVVSGRGLLMGTALETALKLEETCLQPVRGYSYADLRHGPISVVTSGVLAVLVAAGDGPLAAPMVELATDLQSRGARILGIGGTDEFRTRCDVHLEAGTLPEIVAPLTAIVPAQLMIERLARDLGLDPDQPRGLAKVTRTDSE